MDKEFYKSTQIKLIKALAEKNKENEILKTKNTLYQMFLNKQQIEAADAYAERLCERR